MASHAEIKFTAPGNAMSLGRNRWARCAGVYIEAFPPVEAPVIRLRPVTSRGVPSRACCIEIPAASWPAVAAAVTDFVGPPASPQASASVWALVVSHTEGMTHDLFASEADAMAGAAQFARDNWPHRADRDAPDDHTSVNDSDAVTAYFDGHDSDLFEVFSGSIPVDGAAPTTPPARTESVAGLRRVVEVAQHCAANRHNYTPRLSGVPPIHIGNLVIETVDSDGTAWAGLRKFTLPELLRWAEVAQ